MKEMAGEARLSGLQAELAKVNAAFVALSCEYRESKTALQARVKALEADLEVSKKTCKDQEYHMQQTESAGRGKTLGKSGEREALAEMQKRTSELEALNAVLTKRNRELEAGEAETVGLRKRVRELETVEAGFKHLRGVLMTRP
jgi:peptidyl-tRNA hydrolase